MSANNTILMLINSTMKRKNILLLLLLALAWAANGQQTNTLLTQNFDGTGFTIYDNTYEASKWYTYNAGSGNNWELYQNSSYAHSGSYSMCYAFNSSNAANCYLVSEPFSVSASMTQLSVSLYESVMMDDYPETFEVFFVKASNVTTLAGVASATHYGAIASASYTNESYAQVSGSNTNSALKGQSVRVVVHCTSAKDMYRLYIDDITVTETVATTYTVTYNANGGTGTMTDPNSPYPSGSSVTVLSNAFTAPSGMTFSGWNTASDGSDTDYDPNDTFTISANTTLYAQWTASGGSSTYYELVTTIESGAEYLVVYANNNTIASATTIYAMERNAASSNGHLNYGTPTFSDSQKHIITDITPNASGHSITDFVWTVTASGNNYVFSMVNGNTTYYMAETSASDGNLFSNTTYNSNYCDWTIVKSSSYDFFNIHNPYWHSQNTSNYYYLYYSSGFENYWYTTSPGAYEGSARMYLYKKIESYTVTYNANGGTGTMTDPNSPYTSGSTVTVMSNSFIAPSGKTFSHWNTQSGGGGTNYNPGGTFSISGNTTLYAQWVDDCPAQSVPFSENFNSSSSLPSCWTQEYDSHNLNWIVTSDSNYGTGSNAAKLSNSSSGGNYTTKLITPKLNLNGYSSATLTFKHTQVVWSGDQDQLCIYYRKSPSNPWVQLESCYTSSIAATGNTETFTLPAAACTSTCQIAFEGHANYGRGVYVDDVNVTPPAAPPTVTTTAVTTYDATSATMGGNVTNDGGATVTERGVVYSSSNSTPAVGGSGCTTQVIGSGTGAFSQSITGLTAGTTYYVRAYATNGATSYGSVVSFTTRCNPITITDASPWTCDFESYSGTTAAGNGDNKAYALDSDCWDAVTESSYHSPFVYKNYKPAAFSGSTSIEFKSTGAGIAILPEFSNSLNDLNLKFKGCYTNQANQGTLDIGYYYNGTFYSKTSGVTVPNPRGSSDYNNATGDESGPYTFSGTIPSGSCIAIKHSGGSGTPSVNLDDIVVSLNPTLTFGMSPSSTGTMLVTLSNSAITSGTRVAPGASLSISAAPNTGYRFTGWTVSGTGASVASASSASTTLTMGTANTTLTANFEAIPYNITYSPSSNGSVSGAATATYNQSVSVTVTPASGYHLSALYYTTESAPSTHVNISGSSFNMPTDNITIYATFASNDLHYVQSGNNVYMSWDEFTYNVGNTTNYSGVTIYLDKDISVTTIVPGNTWNGSGTNKVFRGTFDGQCHTITINHTATQDCTGLFRFTYNATIRNLKLEGTINSSYSNVASFIGMAQAYPLSSKTTSIENCISNVTINSTANGVAGMVAGASGDIDFKGCVFTGSLSGTSTSANGGFVGHQWNNGTHSFTNCLFAPTSVSSNLTNGYTFDIESTNTSSFTNCYYTTPFGTTQGKQAYTVSAGTYVTVAKTGTPTQYTCSGIDAYSPGMVYDLDNDGMGDIIGGDGDALTLSLSYSGSPALNGYTATAGTLSDGTHTGTNDAYTLTMTDSDAIINADCGYTITAVAEPASSGTFTFTGDDVISSTANTAQVAPDGDVTITATAATGYTFMYWKEGSAVVSTNNAYTLNDVSANHTITANFVNQMAGGGGGGGSNCVSVGDGSGAQHTYSDGYVPVSVYNKYAYHQIIYPKSSVEDVAGTTITSISFNYYGATTPYNRSSVDIYLGTTSVDNYGDSPTTSAWINWASLTPVYSGAMNFTTTGWNEFTLATPFAYNGTENLVLVINDRGNATGNTSNNHFYGNDGTSDVYVHLYVSGSSEYTSKPSSNPNSRIYFPQAKFCGTSVGSDTWVTTVDAFGDVPTGGFVTDANGNVTISNEEGLAWLISNVNALNGCPGNSYNEHTVTLTADVDMSAHTWVPIGTAEENFSGTFEGNGHLIKGITRSEEFPHNGLFGYVSGTANIQNVVVQAELTGNSITTGAVAGTFASTGTISNVEGAGTLTGGALTTAMGGIAGNNTGTIHSSFAVASLTGGASATQMGGIVGNNTGDLLNSYSNATYAGTSASKGGLVGSNSGTVENCYAAGIASGVSAFAGSNSGTIQYCYTDAIGSGYIGTNSTAPTGSATYGAVQSSIKHLDYMYRDNLITKNTNTYVGSEDAATEVITHYFKNHIPIWNGLVSALNQWVRTNPESISDLSSWYRPLTNNINGDLPVLAFPKDSTLVTTDGKYLQYSASLDHLLSEHASNTAYMFHYGHATGVTQTPGANVHVYVQEDAVLLQATSASAFSNTTVGVTFDNSDHGQHAYDFWGNKLNYDWHLLSTPLYRPLTGTTHSSYVASGDPYSYVDVTNIGGYFPDGLITSGNPAVGGTIKWDFYTYYEPHYHWINLKRNKKNHYHQDGGAIIPYNEPDQDLGGNTAYYIEGKGYEMAINQNTFMNATGTLNRGNVSITLTNQEPDDIQYASGWNLVGNPYQAYLDIDKIGKDPIYTYDADQGIFVPYTKTSSENPAILSQYIHPHQAFFVHADSDGETLTFTQGMATTTSTAGSYYREKLNYPLVNLFAEDDAGHRDLTVVEFHRPELGGAPKFDYMRTAPFSLAAHYAGTSYGILFATDDLKRIPVRFQTTENGTVTLTWSTYNGEFHELRLIDNKLGVDYNMLASNSYTFDATIEDYASRFYIVYDCSGTGVDENEDGSSSGSGTFAYIGTDGNIVIDIDAESSHGASLQVIDVLGRVLYSTVCRDGVHTVSTNGLAKGVYLLRLTNGNMVKTQKIVVR